MASKRSKTNAKQRHAKISAEQPSLSPRAVASSSPESSSAALPALTYDGLPEHLTLQECKNWLQALPSQEVLQIKPLQRLQAAITVLQRRDSRQQRQEVQRLLHPWGVLQQIQGRKRKYNEVKKDFIANVVKETLRLKKMQREFGTISPDRSATDASACFSAIQASLQHGSIGRLP